MGHRKYKIMSLDITFVPESWEILFIQASQRRVLIVSFYFLGA